MDFLIRICLPVNTSLLSKPRNICKSQKKGKVGTFLCVCLRLKIVNDFYVSLDTKGPKHGKEDPKNDPHVGGNTWAGGTGGRDTAGLGGKGGPYRLDKGHTVHQVNKSY